MRSIILINLLTILFSTWQTTFARITPVVLDEIALNIEQSIKNGNTSVFNHYYDWTFKWKPEIRPYDSDICAFNQSFKSTFTHTFNPAYFILQEVVPGVEYTYMRCIERENGYVLIYKLNRLGAVNFHEYEVINTINGWKIIDLASYKNHLILSENINSDYLSELYNNIPFYDNPQRTVVNNKVRLAKSKITDLNNSGSFKKIIKLWGKLDSDIKYNITIMQYAIAAYSYTKPDKVKEIELFYIEKHGTYGGIYLTQLANRYS